MTTETTRILDIADWRRRLRPQTASRVAAAPIPTTTTVWVPVIPMMMVSVWMLPHP